MSKNRFTTSDVKAAVRDIKGSILGQRVANIYDLSDKTYLFKFAVPGVAKKIFLLVESGMRFHTTRYTRNKNDMPSPFAMKLRKHIRLKRLEDIRQLGSDRVVDLKFGSGDAICHIILELYASGNIVLTDGNYEIVALLRSHKFEDDISVQVGEIYPIAFTTTVLPAPASTLSSSNNGDDKSGNSSDSNVIISHMSLVDFAQWTEERHREMVQQNEEQQRLKSEAAKGVTGSAPAGGNGKGGGKKAPTAAGAKKQRVKKMNLRQLLLCKESGVALFGPEILDHCLLTAELSPSTKVEDFLKVMNEENVEGGRVTRLLLELRETAPGLLALLDTPGQPGYILLKKSQETENDLDSSSATTSASAAGGDERPEPQGDYYDFVPRLFRQHQGLPYRQLDSFDEAVDEYFCKVEEQRLQHHATSAEEAAKKKVKKVKEEMRSQLQGLADTQLRMEKSACLTEAFAEEVDKACLVINSALAAGISWDDISTMVAAETSAGNPIASLIAKLRLDKNRVVIRLPDILADSDSDSDEDSDSDDGDTAQQSSARKKRTYVDVDLDLGLTAYANASKLYSQRKVARSKEQKTAVAAERAIKAVELSSSKQLVKQQVKRNLQAQRKVHWFEKFNWFVSSEGYLVLSGRDAQQNEQLVKKYLRPGDAYVHADMHGASSCIVRCKVKKDDAGGETALPISPFALHEAGTMTICRSGAWSVKVVMSAWWVHANQVSKTAPTGEYLSTGSFMIYGKKNYLPPTSLEMGFGVMFRLDDGSVSRHLMERMDKSFNGEEAVAEEGSRGAADVGTAGVKRPGVQSEEKTHESGGRERGAEDKKKAPRKTKAQRQAESLALQEQQEGQQEQQQEEQDMGVGLDTVHDSDVVGCEGESQEVRSTVENSEGSVHFGAEMAAAEGDQICFQEAWINDSAVKEQKQNQEQKKGGKPKLTPYQRKMLKKGKTMEEIELLQEEKQRERSEQEATAVAMLEEPMVNIEDESVDPAVVSSQPTSNGGKKKKLSKKKARRYADQDEDDMRLAMRALGHGGTKEGTGGDGVAESEATNARRTSEKAKKQEKAGIHLLQATREAAVATLAEDVKDQMARLVTKKLIKDDELDPFELEALGKFTPAEGLEILGLFDCDNCAGIGNKSGFLAGIMRRFSKNKETAMIKQRQQEAQAQQDPVTHDGVEQAAECDGEDTTAALSRGERKKVEAAEVQMILREEGVLEEQEGRQADQLEKLTGSPLPEDVLLYAVPVCGPYSALKNCKYKVKLTPGTIKKGKACKNAVEVFVNSKAYSTAPPSASEGAMDDGGVSLNEAAGKERVLIKGLTDPEMVAIMIGDVKLSMPGLYNTLKKKKQASKKGKKK